MNSTIAQFVMHACFGNATLRGAATLPCEFPQNSTFQYCERVQFVETFKPFFGAARIRPVATTPEGWFANLRRREAAAIRLTWTPRNDPRIADHQSAAFAGGGGDWALVIAFAQWAEVWRSRWEVFDRNAPEQRIWRVTYGPAQLAPAAAADVEGAFDPGAVCTALTHILAFAQSHDTGGFAASFRAALDALDGSASAPAAYPDICPPGMLPDAALRVLDAAQKAWVFGGMGSWNDMSFDGEDGQEYMRVSAALYATLSRAICASANLSAA